MLWVAKFWDAIGFIRKKSTGTTEVWMRVHGHPYLEASTLGRLRTPARINSYGRAIRGRILNQHEMRNGYLTASARFPNDSRDAPHLVSRLVCMAFHGGPPFESAEVRHLDGDRKNNAPENLAWGTAKENSMDKVLHGTLLLGEKAPGSKITDAQALEIRAKYDAGDSLSKIGREFGVTRSNICYIGKRKTFRHLSPLDRPVSPLIAFPIPSRRTA